MASQETGNYIESFVSNYMRPEDGKVPDREEQDILKWCSAALYVGGADTVSLKWEKYTSIFD